MDVSEFPGPRNLHFADHVADHFAEHLAEHVSDHVSDHAANLFLQAVLPIGFPGSFWGVFNHFATNQMRCTDVRDQDGSLALVSSAHGNPNIMHPRKIIAKLILKVIPRRGSGEDHGY